MESLKARREALVQQRDRLSRVSRASTENMLLSIKERLSSVDKEIHQKEVRASMDSERAEKASLLEISQGDMHGLGTAPPSIKYISPEVNQVEMSSSGAPSLLSEATTTAGRLLSEAKSTENEKSDEVVSKGMGSTSPPPSPHVMTSRLSNPRLSLRGGSVADRARLDFLIGGTGGGVSPLVETNKSEEVLDVEDGGVQKRNAMAAIEAEHKENQRRWEAEEAKENEAKIERASREQELQRQEQERRFDEQQQREQKERESRLQDQQQHEQQGRERKLLQEQHKQQGREKQLQEQQLQEQQQLERQGREKKVLQRQQHREQLEREKILQVNQQCERQEREKLQEQQQRQKQKHEKKLYEQQEQANAEAHMRSNENKQDISSARVEDRQCHQSGERKGTFVRSESNESDDSCIFDAGISSEQLAFLRQATVLHRTTEKLHNSEALGDQTDPQTSSVNPKSLQNQNFDEIRGSFELSRNGAVGGLLPPPPLSSSVVERVGFAEQQLQLAFDYEDKGSDGDLKAAAQAYELCLDWGAGLVELLTLHNPPVSAGSGGDKSVDSPTSLDETAVAAIGQWREFRGEAAYNLGGLLQDLGRPREESMARYQEVLKYTEGLGNLASRAHYNLGLLFDDDAAVAAVAADDSKGADDNTTVKPSKVETSLAKAVESYTAALKLVPDWIEARHNLALASAEFNATRVAATATDPTVLSATTNAVDYDDAVKAKAVLDGGDGGDGQENGGASTYKQLPERRLTTTTTNNCSPEEGDGGITGRLSTVKSMASSWAPESDSSSGEEDREEDTRQKTYLGVNDGESIVTGSVDSDSENDGEQNSLTGGDDMVGNLNLSHNYHHQRHPSMFDKNSFGVSHSAARSIAEESSIRTGSSDSIHTESSSGDSADDTQSDDECSEGDEITKQDLVSVASAASVSSSSSSSSSSFVSSVPSTKISSKVHEHNDNRLSMVEHINNSISHEERLLKQRDFSEKSKASPHSSSAYMYSAPQLPSASINYYYNDQANNRRASSVHFSPHQPLSPVPAHGLAHGAPWEWPTAPPRSSQVYQPQMQDQMSRQQRKQQRHLEKQLRRHSSASHQKQLRRHSSASHRRSSASLSELSPRPNGPSSSNSGQRRRQSSSSASSSQLHLGFAEREEEEEEDDDGMPDPLRFPHESDEEYKSRRVAEMRAWRASRPFPEVPVRSAVAVPVQGLRRGSLVPTSSRIGGNLSRPTRTRKLRERQRVASLPNILRERDEQRLSILASQRHQDHRRQSHESADYQERHLRRNSQRFVADGDGGGGGGGGSSCVDIEDAFDGSIYIGGIHDGTQSEQTRGRAQTLAHQQQGVPSGLAPVAVVEAPYYATMSPRQQAVPRQSCDIS